MKSIRMHLLFVVVALMTLSVTANAAVLVFTDRASWRIAAGGGTGDLTEDFNSFSGTTVYGNTTGIDAGFLHFAVVSGDYGGDTSWSVRDSSPVAGSKTVNGTPYVSLVSYQPPAGDTLITHANISAIGFDYAGPSNTPSNDANPLTLTTSLGDDITGPVILGVSSGFVGIVYTEGEVFNSVQIRDLTDDRTFFGADDFEAYSTGVVPASPSVPVPTTSQWALIMLTMLLGLMVFVNRRRLF